MAIIDYRNFDLLLARSGDRYRAFVVDAPGGEASVLFDLPFEPAELDQWGAVFRIGRSGGTPTKVGTTAKLADLGRHLFEAIFQGKVGDVLTASLSSVAQEGVGLRLRLRFEEDAADLAGLPWEILYDPTVGQFVGLGERSPILRYLSLPRSRSALLVQPPLQLLAVLSSPADLPKLDLDREWGVIQAALENLIGAGKFKLERLDTPTLPALQSRLMGDPVHILHFVGHGVFDESAGSLVLEDGRQGAKLVGGEQLAILLRDHTNMRLVYLNACQGALASGHSVFAGAAQSLVHGGVPAAIAMQAEISDSGAIELARAFYTALAAGRPVDAALAQARVALSVTGSPEWAIPVLFSRSPDNRLFDIQEVLPTPDCPYPGMKPFTEGQKDLFFGRDKEIDAAVAQLRKFPFLAVVGPSGSGKSSLCYAGIIPALRKSHHLGPGELVVKDMRPGGKPVEALAEALGMPQTPLRLPPNWGEGTERMLLVIDQFEEIFTLAEPEAAEAFLDAIKALIGQPSVYILLTVRADFYSNLMASSLWPPIQANRLELTPLGDDELWAAIVEPAARVGVTVEDALAVKLIADAAGQSGVLPLVQETLWRLWDKVERRQLGLAAYREMVDGGRSGLQVAIDRHASAVYNNLPEEAKPIARRIFLRLVQLGANHADIRRQQPVAALRSVDEDREEFDRTLEHLAQHRLITLSGEEHGEDRQADIAHEALITCWQTLASWVKARREADLTRRRLEGKGEEWVRLRRGTGGLLDKEELSEAERWLASPDAAELGYSAELEALVGVSRSALRTQRLRQGTLVASLLIVVLAVLAVLGRSVYREWVRMDTGTDLVEIKEGPAIIGPVDPAAGPNKTLLSFQIEKYEVSIGQYRACIKSEVCTARDKTEFEKGVLDDYPAVSISAAEAHLYCTWLGRRLPTAVEWERAARGDKGRPWPWGQNPDDYEWPDALVKVDLQDGDRTPEGVFHMAYNVLEWVVEVPPDCDGVSCHQAGDETGIAYARIGRSPEYPSNDPPHVAWVTSADSNIVDDQTGFRCAASLP